MALSILNNIPSLVAQNQLAVTTSKLQDTLFQLSSGSKINSGADDPAGLSIADGLQANIMALTQSSQNVTNGVGMLQTADGALSQVTTLLNRAVTLATEAGSAGLTSGQYSALDNEFQKITAQINQVGANTTYNNTQVFTTNPVNVFLTDGSQLDENNTATPDSISVNMQALSASSLQLGNYATGTLDLQGTPSDGNTVTVGTQTYTFKTTLTNNGSTANEVAIGGSAGQALQNLMQAVNNGPNGAGSTTAYGAGTNANGAAKITSVNGGSATVQALASGVTNVALSSMLTSAAGSSSALTVGGKAAVSATGTLTLPNNAKAASYASGTLTLTGAVTANDTVTVGGNTYTFVAAGTASTANSVSLDSNGSLTADLNNLANAITGGNGNNPLSAGAMTYYASDPVTAGVAASVTGNVMTITSTAAGTAGNSATAFSASISHSNGAVANVGGGGQLGGGAAADTAIVGASTYTFVAAGQALSGSEVAVGTTANDTLNNLMAAVNTGGANAGNSFTSSGANADVRMAVLGNTATFTAYATNAADAGTGGNGLALSTVITGAVSTGPLANGAQAVGGQASLNFSAQPHANDTVSLGGSTYTFVASGTASSGNEVSISSVNLAGTLANLVGAVMTGGAGSAGAYYTNNGTAAANPNVSLSITSPGVVTAVGLNPASGNTYGNGLTVSANLSGGAGGVVGSGTLTGGTTAVSLLSASGAQAALQAITNAIGAVASQRGSIGSGINEMNAAVLVMNNTSQNLTSSLSGIQDANIGQVVANMSKYQVLEQTGISALAQSNQQEQAVLKLLQ